MVVETEVERLQKFGDFLRAEDRAVYEDLLNQCKLYASYASTMASPIKEVPLIISMLFAQHKRILALEKWIRQNLPLKETLQDPPAVNSVERPFGKP